METPVARYIGNDVRLALAVVPLVVGVAWGTHHVMEVVTAFAGKGDPMALTWLGCFLLLWWLPLCWLEKPHSTTDRILTSLKQLSLSVQIPVYNEEPARVEHCLRSLFEQTVLPSKILVVDDGTTKYDYTAVEQWFYEWTAYLGIVGTWTRTENRGKRHAQMEVLAHDDGDIYMTLDSDTILDRHAIEEGIKPFADPRVQSVAGMVAVWNSHGNWLARLTCMLYTPFTRGYRSAQGIFGQVMVNSGTLAWYRGDVIRRYAGAYENEMFWGKPMQMNDDSMMTMYGLLHGRAVHQPTAVAYTIVPERIGEYRRQQMRWMRGTLVRTFWWWRYMPMTSMAFWMPIIELLQIIYSLLIWPVVLLQVRDLPHLAHLTLVTLGVMALVNYTIALRYFIIQRSDESVKFQLSIFLLAPLAGLWRHFFLFPVMVYCYATFWKVGSWGTRGTADKPVELAPVHA
jgi:hyaluronan synthase